MLVVLVAVFLSYNANTGLPFVPTYQLKVEVAERRQPGARQRGADRRLARRRGRHDHGASGSTTARASRVLDAQARARRRAAAEGLDGASSARSRRSASSTSRSRAGSSDQGYADGDTIPLAGVAPAPVEFDEFIEHVRRARRATAIADEPRRASATRSPGRGESLNTAIGALPAAAARHRAGGAQPGRPATRSLTRFFNGARRDRRAIVAPGRRDAGAAVRRTSTPRSPRSPRSPARSSRTRSPRAGRRSTQAIASFPHQRPFLRNCERLFRELRPGVRALRSRGAGPRRRARDRHADAAALAARSTAASRTLLQRAAGLRRGPAGAARRRARSTDDGRRRCNPTLQLPRARPD